MGVRLVLFISEGVSSVGRDLVFHISELIPLPRLKFGGYNVAQPNPA